MRNLKPAAGGGAAGLAAARAGPSPARPQLAAAPAGPAPASPAKPAGPPALHYSPQQRLLAREPDAFTRIVRSPALTSQLRREREAALTERQEEARLAGGRLSPR